MNKAMLKDKLDPEFDRKSDHFDIDFQIPQTQRLRFTENVFKADVPTLAELIEPSGPAPAKVQIWLDVGLREHFSEDIDQMRAALDQYPQIHVVPEIGYVPGGEAAKQDPKLIEEMWSAFHEANMDRRSYILAIGGGAVLDAVGYAAGTAHRGIRIIRIPTTTLGQTDSGVGVKNAINFFGKKNWLGTFATPWAVINDTSVITRLPDRDFRCGFSEAVKVSLLKSRPQFEHLVANASNIRNREPEATLQAIKDSILLHLHHITRNGDPFEAEIARPLDFGHWSAHKLEPMTSYSLRHGEAVSIGVALDCLYSSRVHNLSREDAYRVVRCLAQLGLPTSHDLLSDKAVLFNGLEEFRQHLGGELTVTMIDAPGSPVDVHQIDDQAMSDSIDELLAISNGADAIGHHAA